MTEIPHLGFIVAAYAVATVAIVAMIGAILIDYRLLTADLRALQNARGEGDEET